MPINPNPPVLDHAVLDHFVFLDLETTGGSLIDDRIIEIGLVAVATGRVVDA